MKLQFAIPAILLLLLSGCSSGPSSTASSGEELYNKSCAACHGEKMEGRVGPALTNLKSKYSEADLQDIIMQGTPRMPGNLLSEEEATVVIRWLFEK